MKYNYYVSIRYLLNSKAVGQAIHIFEAEKLDVCIKLVPFCICGGIYAHTNICICILILSINSEFYSKHLHY